MPEDHPHNFTDLLRKQLFSLPGSFVQFVHEQRDVNFMSAFLQEQCLDKQPDLHPQLTFLHISFQVFIFVFCESGFC